MTKYTIKSTSDEGIYYLVNGWEKHKTFWVSESATAKNPDIKKLCFFNKPSQAKASLTKLLKIMSDYYASDNFELVEFN